MPTNKGDLETARSLIETAIRESEVSPSAAETKNASETKEWTVMIYMSGENNLSADMVYSIQRLRNAVNESSNINLFVYYDGYSPSVPTMYCDFSDPKSEYKYYRTHLVDNKLYRKHRDFDENSAAMYSIANYVDWCVNKVEHTANGKPEFGRKANRYALIFSGHSMGFQSVGLLKDDNAGYHMTLAKMKWMLERLTKKTHELERMERASKYGADEVKEREKWNERITEFLGQKLDILGFDSCVMGMLEVGYEFQGVARTLIASEGSIPNAGWTYAEILSSLGQRPAIDSTADVAKDFVRKFIETQDNNTFGGVSVDMAAWDLRAIHDLEGPFREFALSLIACFEKKDGEVYTQMRRLLVYVHWRCQSYLFEQNVDLVDLCELLIEEISVLARENGAISPLLNGVSNSAEELIKAVRSAILIRGFSGGKYQYSNGMSIYFPWTLGSYRVSQKNYEALDFVKKMDGEKNWNDFLRLFAGDVTLRRSKQVGVKPPIETVYLNHRFAENRVAGVAEANGKVPEDGTSKVPEDGTSKIPEDGTSKVPEDGTSKVPEDGTSKVPENGTSKVPEDGTSKVPEDGTSKVPNDLSLKIPEDGSSKIPKSGTDRIPENGSDKIFGGGSLFFSQFMDIKNIQMFWNVSGISDVDDTANILIRSGEWIKFHDLIKSNAK